MNKEIETKYTRVNEEDHKRCAVCENCSCEGYEVRENIGGVEVVTLECGHIHTFTSTAGNNKLPKSVQCFSCYQAHYNAKELTEGGMILP